MNKTLLSLLLIAFSVPVLSQKTKTPVKTIEDTIQSNEEEPKVLYIIPWKDSNSDPIALPTLSPSILTDIPKRLEEVDITTFVKQQTLNH